MTEVEIRAKIEDIKQIEASIIKMGGGFVAREHQVDKIFGREEDLDSNHMIIEGHFSARIRQKGESVKVEFKEIRRTGSGREISAQIANIADGVYFLNQLGFSEVFTIDKIRHKYILNDFEIALDDVKKLGTFIEIEHPVKTGEDSDAAILECKALLAKIDNKATNEPRKYGDLMQEMINSKNKILR